MNQDELKYDIAEMAYNVSYGANRHFATYDIVSKLPGAIGFSSLAFGIIGLAFEVTTNLTSVVFIMLSIAALFITMYEPKKAAYHERGAHLNALAGELLALYRKVGATDCSTTLQQVHDEFQTMKNAYYRDGGNIGQQILLSDSLAHYKMFGTKKQQSQWFENELELTLFRDKIPFYLIATAVLAVISCIGFVIYLVLRSQLLPFLKGVIC